MTFTTTPADLTKLHSAAAQRILEADQLHQAGRISKADRDRVFAAVLCAAAATVQAARQGRVG